MFILVLFRSNIDDIAAIEAVADADSIYFENQLDMDSTFLKGLIDDNAADIAALDAEVDADSIVLYNKLQADSIHFENELDLDSTFLRALIDENDDVIDELEQKNELDSVYFEGQLLADSMALTSKAKADSLALYTKLTLDSIAIRNKIKADSLALKSELEMLKQPIAFEAFVNSSISQISIGPIPFNQEVFDDGSNFTSSQHYFSVPIDGNYHFVAQVSLLFSENVSRYISIFVDDEETGSLDGIRVATTRVIGPDDDYFTLVVSKTLKLEAGNRVYVRYNGSTTDIDPGRADAFFTGHLLR